MSSKILLFAIGSHDLSQPEQIHKIHPKWSWVKNVVILSENSCHFVSCSACNNKDFLNFR